MAQVAKKVQDKTTRQIFSALKKAFPNLPEESERVVYRYNPAAIRIRIISPRFVGKTTDERDALVNAAFESLPPDATDDVTMLIMLTPREAKKSHQMLSREFDDPTGEYL
jgi:stress-induced morphogen